MLFDGEQVGEHLAGVQEVCQSIDDRNIRIFCQLHHPFMAVSANHDAVQVTRQHPGRVLDRLTAAQLQVTVGEEQGLPSQLIHACLKGNPGAGGRLLKDHAQSLARQQLVLNACLLLGLEFCCQFQYLLHFPYCKFVDREQIPAF